MIPQPLAGGTDVAQGLGLVAGAQMARPVALIDLQRLAAAAHRAAHLLTLGCATPAEALTWAALLHEAQEDRARPGGGTREGVGPLGRANQKFRPM